LSENYTDIVDKDGIINITEILQIHSFVEKKKPHGSSRHKRRPVSESHEKDRCQGVMNLRFISTANEIRIRMPDKTNSNEDFGMIKPGDFTK